MEVVAAIIRCGNKILCMQRNKGKYEYISYKYEFPGGKVEEGETRVEALARELKEEMGIEVNISEKEYFMSSSYTYPDFSITLHAYLCQVASKDFVLKEHKSYVWSDIASILSLDWAGADIEIVQEVVRRFSA